jgi:ribosomal RNA assembly protein
MHDKLKRKEFDEMVNGAPDEREFLREDLDTDEDFTDAEEDYNQAALDQEESEEDVEEVPEDF